MAPLDSEMAAYVHRELELQEITLHLGNGIDSFAEKGKMVVLNVDSLPMLIENAMELGVKVIACSMSMDVMGIRKEELIDGVEIGGVATYLGKANDSNLNLFI